ncbi:hypothetical protein DM01DRAFT_351232 [Hesseltinella vesiculosa]|uniref:Uncharacterized protein n=1 Tax=Hesseltinella vesiculosa TaxID=101127 RepID=A0A1X2G9S4_9FUNG|nr:hypothetical protein DM01DRAFT_351232 [Hesseltinella vesiculosa]
MKKLQNLLSSKKKNDRPSSGYKKTALETSRPILSPMPSSSQQRQMGAKTEYPHIQTSIQPPHTSAKIEPRNQPVHSPTPSSSQPVQPKIEVSDQQLSNLLANATIVSMTTPNFADLVPEEPAATKSLPPPLPAHDDTEEQITKEQAVENRIYQIEKNIEHINNGALQVSAWKVMEEVSVSVYLQGLDKDSFFTREVSDGTTQTHEAFKLLKAIDIVEEKKEKYRDDHRFRTLDSEILDKYEGVVPGTVTAEAYGNEMSLLAKTDDRFTFTFSTASAPEGLTVKKLVARLNELQKGGLGHVWAADRQKVLYEDLMKYITSSSTWFDPNEKYKWSTQARELIDRLNNGNIFMDLSENSSFLVFFQEMGLPDCFYQILLGTELRLRLPLIGDWYFTGSRTRTVKTSLIISKRWQDHVRVTYDDEKESIQWRSNVHEQQIDGLLRFADTMGWPYMESLRPVAETVYPNMISGGQEVNSQIWDWLYGVVLPGKYASFKIMTTLVMLTPETKDLKWAPFYNSGLVVEGCSFWRLKSILGRVLGGSPGATGLMHWVGPCPPVIEGLDDGVKMSWVLIKARSVDDPGLINLERSFTDVNVFEYFADDFKKNPDMLQME